jgi:xanthine dehydrogenase YagT iron-sulfur-binding subunit
MPDLETKAGPPHTGHNRRDFLRGSGLAAASAVVAGTATQALQEARGETAQEAGAKLLAGNVDIKLKVNGKEMTVAVEPRCTLLDTLRNRLDVTGPKRVCDRSACGACTVILDGAPVYSCTTLAVSCQGCEIETLENFDTGEKGVPHAFHQNDALMCGYCTPGFVTACKALLDKNPNATLEEVKRGLDGNICRCGTYVGVLQAALDAAKAMKGA